MTTPHVLDQLPLWVEGDLTGQEAAAVDRHLAECPSCQEAAGRLRTSQAWLRQALEPPFDASDRERLRHSVMAQIRRSPSPPSLRRFPMRPVLLAACAASLLLAALIWPLEQGLPGQPVVVADSPRPKRAEPSSEPAMPNPVDRRIKPLPSARVRPTPKLPAESPPQDEPARIEFQTSDPSIRIIWLAQAKPLPDMNPPLQEQP